MKTVLKSLFGTALMLSILQSAYAESETKKTSSKKPLYREINPNAGPRVAYGYDVFLTGDFLLWKTRQDGLVFGLTGANTSQAQTTADANQNVISGRNKSVTMHWEPGFKIGAGLNFWHDGWDVCAEYSWLHTHGTNHFRINNNTATQNVIPSFSPPPNLFASSTFFANTVKSTNRFRFNAIDLELGRNFYTSQFLKLRPHIGLKGTWQSQDWRTRYFSDTPFVVVVTDDDDANFTGPYRVQNRSKFYGIGFRTGLDTSWQFTNNWGLFGDFAMTGLWSRYMLYRKDTLDNENSEADNKQTVNTSYDFYNMKFIAEFDLGLRFEVWFYDDRFHFLAQAGWEEQIWINHMTYIQIQNMTPFYDLTMHGLTAKIRFDF